MRPKTNIIVSVIAIFVNERVPDDSCESVFKFLVMNSCVICRQSKSLMIVIRLKCRDLKCFNNSFFYYYFPYLIDNTSCVSIVRCTSEDIA